MSTPRIMVTNDDGIDSAGLHALVVALATVGEVSVIAPDRNRSAVSRGITLGQTLSVVEADVEGAAMAYATDGTPTDCVRFAALGLCGERPDLVVSGANHGLNLGDDVTYSGTVAAAFEGAIMDIPAIAVSQQSLGREMGFARLGKYDFSSMQQFVPLIVRAVLNHEVPHGTVMNVNVPGLLPEMISGVEVSVLGKRIYRDKLELQAEKDGHRHFTIYGDDPSHHDEPDTDIAAIGRSAISVTPIRYDLTARALFDDVSGWGLSNNFMQQVT